MRLLDDACSRLGPAAPAELLATRERATETRDRLHDDRTAGEAFRPVRLDRALGAQLGTILLALP